jgi:DNA-binding MarR family transcriptional regulator
MEKLPKEVSTTILLLVHRREKLTMSEICERTKFSTITVLKHVNALMGANLLKEEREKNFPRRRLIKATDEGNRIAALLNLSDASSFSSSELIEMGAKAGRISSYQEMLSSLKKTNVTKDFLTAELLLKGIGSMAEGLGMVSKGFPENLKDGKEAVKSVSEKLASHYVVGQTRLKANDINGCVGEVTKALSELIEATKILRGAVTSLKDSRFDEIANYLEFLGPKTTQKE